MKYSYQILQELSGTKKSAEQLAELLMTHAFEVEGIEKFPHGIEDVVIGKVVALARHPQADKLHVAQVEVGKKAVHTIVCGAPNIAKGQKVAVALPGVQLPGGIAIKSVKLRGVESSGMICSAQELGLGDDHTGILILSQDAPIGASFAKFIGLDDSVMEVKILPDRGSDALAYQGLAREIAALDGHAPHFSEKSLKPVQSASSQRVAKVVIADTSGCPRYGALAVHDVTTGESPLWLKVRLIVSGLRPINNVVDTTNYLMLLTGQPTHAFDADKIHGTVTVRRAKKDETLVLLTGETKTLTPDDLVIADTKQVLALAGVMGGRHSAVTPETKNIFLEVANFEGASVRRTKNRHNVPTDASYRFERNLDPNLIGEVLKEAATLFPELCGGRVVDVCDVYPKKISPWKITCSLDRVERVLGIKIPLFEVVRHLALLGLTVKKVANERALLVTVPTRRPDLRDEWDLIEEIGRMHGYDRIVAEAPYLPLQASTKNSEKLFERSVKTYLAAAGFDELMTYSFYGEKDISITRLPLEQHLELEHPLSPEQKYLRMTLVPLHLRKAAENLRHFENFDYFELGKIFCKDTKTKQPRETVALSVLSLIPKKSEHGEGFYALKGRLSALFSALHIDESKIAIDSPKHHPSVPLANLLHPTRSACYVFSGQVVGFLGEVRPEILKLLRLEPRVVVGEFFTSQLMMLQERETVFVPLQKFPYALRDISLVLPKVHGKTVPVAEVEALLREAGSPLLQKFELFDIYEKQNEKSLAFHLFFGAPDRTLSSEEMDAIFDRIVSLASSRYAARLRL